MGLASALTTALTGLTAAETQIDVIGNNLANSQTVGFKASDTIFATQFLQTLSLGSAPTDNSGGRNPRQIGLGTQVAEIAPNFTQGTIEISSSPSDLAIQGDGFFMVEATTGERLYTRNGIFQINSQNELVNTTGNRVLGYGVDEFFTLQTTQLVPLELSIGSAAVAQPTQNVYLEGTLTPTGDLADTAEVIQSATLGDGIQPRPDASGVNVGVAPVPGVLTGNYSYLVTYYTLGSPESRPSLLIGPTNVSNGQLELTNLPLPPAPYNQIRVYRNLATDDSSFHLAATLNPGQNFTDNLSDATIAANPMIDLDGPRIDSNTLLTNVLRRDDLDYEQVFTEGTLTFEGRKGGRSLGEMEFEITATSTVQDLIDFMQDSMGIRSAADDPQFPIPGSVNNIPGETTPLSSGGSISNGRIRFVANNGIDNALDIPLSAFSLQDVNGTITSPNLGFGSVQDAQGQSAFTEFTAYDSLGIPINVRLTAVLEDRTGTETVYRWFADSSDNDPLTGNEIAVGTGLIRFDGEGNVVTVTNDTVSIDRRNIPSASPLEFDLDVTQVSGLAADESTIAASRQDGAEAGRLSTFRIDENGTIEGAFTNGMTRTLGQVRLARFANPNGLDQQGLNLYAEGANSGLPIEGTAGENGIGSLIAGAVELSNTDIGQDLIELVLATTMFRGNTRVISTAQELLDELLNLRR